MISHRRACDVYQVVTLYRITVYLYIWYLYTLIYIIVYHCIYSECSRHGTQFPGHRVGAKMILLEDGDGKETGGQMLPEDIDISIQEDITWDRMGK